MDALAQQYAYLRRDLVRDGRLRSLWKDRGRAAVRLLPVLGLLGRGYLDTGTFVNDDWLRALSGLSRSRVLIALSDLAANFVTLSSMGCRPGVTWFRLEDIVIATGRTAGFQFPGNLVADQTWAQLSDVECLLLLTVAALAGDLHHPLDNAPDDWSREWLEQLAEDYADSRPVERRDGSTNSYPFVPRYLRTTLAELGDASGLDRGQVSRTLQSLAAIAPDRLLDRRTSELGIQIHLPWHYWTPGPRLALARMPASAV